MDSAAGMTRSVSPDITEPVAIIKKDHEEEKEEEEESPKDDSNDTSKIRRSKRIKKLETSRGGNRRREVVHSISTQRESLQNRSFDQEDDSNSNSGSGYSLSTSMSVPNLANLSLTSPFGEAGPNAGTTPSTSTALANTQTSTMKLKSRWRNSLDAESFMSSNTVDTANTFFNVSGDPQLLISFSPSGGEIPEANAEANKKAVYQPRLTLVKRPGHVLADSADTELTDKLKKFEGIDESIFLTERHVSKEGGMVCDCFLTREEIAHGEIGCNEDCLNRLLMVECGSRCPTGERCTNKAFQKKQYCGLEVFRTERKGHGLRSTQRLPAGGFVIEYVGEVLDSRQFKQRVREYAKENQEHFYFMALKSDAIIDATLRGNCSRFINHSCEPNCETQKWTVNGELRIGFFAISDLEAGEEITFDYQFQRYGKKAQQCFCMTPSCRGWIGAETEEDEETIARLRRAEKKKRRDSQWEDISFEEELCKLEATGLRNKIQTLNLCRLMVRAEEWDARERILNIIISGEEPCRRLFLDYHGLRLLWAWMTNLPLPCADTETQLIRNERYHLLLLTALKTLPIPNKTILQESKILSIMEKWSTAPSTSTIIIKTLKPEILEATSSISTTDKVVSPPIEPESEIKNLEEQLSSVEIQPVTTISLKKETNEIDTWSILGDASNLGAAIDPSHAPDAEADSNIQEINAVLVPKTECAVENVSTLEAKSSDTHEVDSFAGIRRMDVDNSAISVDVSNQEAVGVKIESVIEELQWLFVETTKELLTAWANLKEVFRIPKKERVEQMKQHERAADNNERLSSIIRRPTASPFLSYSKDSLMKDKKGDRKVPVIECNRDRGRDHHFRQYNRTLILRPQSNLSKAERRHLFAERVARQEEEERKRRTQDEVVALHQERCARLGLDAKIVPIVDQSCTYYLDPTTVSWREIDLNDSTLPPELALIVQDSQFPVQHEVELVPDILTPDPSFVFPPWPEGLPPPPPLPPSILPRGWRMSVDDEGRCYYYDIRSRQSQWYPPSPESSAYNSSSEESDSSEDEDNESEATGTDADPQAVSSEVRFVYRLKLKVSDRSERRKKSGLVEERIISPRYEDDKPAVSQKSIRARKLQLMEQKIRQETSEAQGLGKDVEEDADESIAPTATSSGDEIDPTDSEIDTGTDREDSTQSVANDSEPNSIENSSSGLISKEGGESNIKENSTMIPGLSPDSATNEASKQAHTSADDAISLVRGHASSKSLTPTLNKLSEKKKTHRKGKPTDKREREKHKSSGSGAPPHKKGKSPSIEVFRSQIANIIVQHLNPYRKPQCKYGRITSTEDFKHLARKMTHAIALKELKHCRDGKTLVVSESVKHKTKEYVKKYMAKYKGKEYVKSPEETSTGLL